eukprot:39493_1
MDRKCTKCWIKWTGNMTNNNNNNPVHAANSNDVVLILKKEIKSDNEFENDVHTAYTDNPGRSHTISPVDGSRATTERNANQDQYTDNDSDEKDDTKLNLPKRNTNELSTLNGVELLQNEDVVQKLKNEAILFDSLLTIHDLYSATRTDMGAILTESSLYFISAVNYQTWNELKTRTEINALITDQQKINDDLSFKLAKKLDLIKNEKLQKLIIAPYFSGRSKKK